MKKLIIIVIFIVTVMFFEYDAYSQPQCPNGFSQSFVTLTVNGCDYTVEICYICYMNRPSEVHVFGFSKIDPNCPQTWNINQVLAYIYSQVFTPLFLNNLCGLPGPCESGNELWYSLFYEICWEKIWSGGRVWYLPCNFQNCYCWELWKICWDPALGQFVNIFVQGPGVSCPGYDPAINKCPNPESSVQDPTPYDPGPTNCFYISSPCYP